MTGCVSLRMPRRDCHEGGRSSGPPPRQSGPPTTEETQMILLLIVLLIVVLALPWAMRTPEQRRTNGHFVLFLLAGLLALVALGGVFAGAGWLGDHLHTILAGAAL